MSKKRRYEKKSFESATPKDTSVCIYESMLISDAFMDLSKNQRLLYIYVKKQLWSKNRPPKNKNLELDERCGDEAVYFNLDLAIKYNLYSKNNKNSFYADLEMLIDHGFLEEIVHGENQFQKSIYKLSPYWRNWKKGKTFLPEWRLNKKKNKPKKEQKERELAERAESCPWVKRELEKEKNTGRKNTDTKTGAVVKITDTNKTTVGEKIQTPKTPKSGREKFLNADFKSISELC